MRLPILLLIFRELQVALRFEIHDTFLCTQRFDLFCAKTSEENIIMFQAI